MYNWDSVYDTMDGYIVVFSLKRVSEGKKGGVMGMDGYRGVCTGLWCCGGVWDRRTWLG